MRSPVAAVPPGHAAVRAAAASAIVVTEKRKGQRSSAVLLQNVSLPITEIKALPGEMKTLMSSAVGEKQNATIILLPDEHSKRSSMGR